MKNQTKVAVLRALQMGLLLAATAGLGGCAGLGSVEPWQKGVLAKPAMGFDADRLENNFAEHTYFSKEASSGGAGVGTGGCGCN